MWGLFFEEGILAMTPQGCLFNHWNGIPRFDFDIHWRHRLACPSQDASHHQDMPLSLFTKGDSYKLPFRYRDRGLSPQRHGRNGGATEDGYERSGAICLRSLAEDLATGSKIPSPNGEFLETSWELIINKLSNSQGYPVRGRGQYQTPWYILCFVADNLHVTTFWINFNKTWNHVENQPPKL